MSGKKRDVVVAGSGNVFQDLGFIDSEERKLRVQLAVRLDELIDEHHLARRRPRRFEFFAWWGGVATPSCVNC